jgi:pSer/pThr/pTyr-binding forkhead associated (FHA) protein
VTVIGRAEGCDVRLNVEGVYPVHCVLVATEGGLVLHAVQGSYGTQVNGLPPSSSPLANGDRLTVGPFQFLLSLPEPTGAFSAGTGTQTEEYRTASKRDQQALRIQAAAVVAQQAALTEEEARLQERQAALERQESQLASHLEERRKHLVELQRQVREARQALQEERAAHEQRVAEATTALASTRREVMAGQQRLKDNRQRLAVLYRRLKKRYARHGKAQLALEEQRERELALAWERLERDKAALVAARLQFNGEVELGRRELQDGWNRLRETQQQWEEQRSREEAALRQQAHDLDERQTSLARSEQLLTAERQLWVATRVNLQHEAEGLENRVRNLRRRLQEHRDNQVLEPVPPSLTVSSLVPALQPLNASPGPSGVCLPCSPLGEPPSDDQLMSLEQLAGELMDQRLHLLEQGARLVRARQEWERERQTALAELETLTENLHDQENQLGQRAEALGEAESELYQRQQEAAQLRAFLESWQARLTVREGAWQTDHQTVLVDFRRRTEYLERRLQALEALRQRWADRRRQEVAWLHSDRQCSEEARQKYVAQWEDYCTRSTALDRERRTLAERAQALEQYQLEVIGRADDPARVEKRLERLRRRWAGQTAATRRQLAQERQSLAAEAHRLENDFLQLREDQAALTRARTEFSVQLAKWEQDQLQLDTCQDRHDMEVQKYEAVRRQHEQQLQVLRDEVERLARLLIGDDSSLLCTDEAA